MTSVVLVTFAVAAIGLLITAGYLFFGLAPRREQEESMSARLLAGQPSAETVISVESKIIQGSGPITDTINRSLSQAGLRSTGRALWLALASGIAVVALVWIVLGFLPALIALGVVSVIAYLVIRQMQIRYRQKIVHQLPEFLEHVIRALAAGNTLETAFSAATDESEEPIKSLFARVIRQLKLGAPLDEVLAEAAEIHQVKDLHVVALSAKINRKYGGSLRRLLKVLINAIHQRERSIAELRAMTGETRMSAVVLVLIPIGIITFILLQNPDYYRAAWADPVGRWLLLGTGVLQGIGAYVIYRLMRTAGKEC